MAGKINKVINVKVEGVGKIKELEASLKKLRKQQRDIKKDMKDGANAGKHAEQQYKKNENAIKGQSKALRETKKAMLDANNATKKGTSLQNSMFMGVVKGAAAFSILITAFRRVSSALTTMIGTFTEFEFVMAKVKAVSGATPEEFEKLTKAAEDLGRSTFFTASEVANLQLNLSKLGFTTDEILEATQATINLSIATGSDLARAATVAGNAIRGFQLDASEAGRVVDVMAVAFTSSALDIEKWQTSMTKVAPIAAMAGFSIEETTAIMAKLSDTGIEASIAGTSLRNIFLKMQDPTSELTRKVGHTISSLDGMLKVFKDMQDEGTDLADVLTFMDVRQVAAFGTMLEGADDIQDLVEELEKADGAGQRMADTVGDTLQGSILKVKSAFQGLSISIVKNFGGALKETLKNLAKWLNELAKNPKKLQEIGDKIKFVIKMLVGYVVGAKVAKLWTSLMASAFVTMSTGAQRASTMVRILTYSLKAFRTALLSTGIGLAVVWLGEYAAKWMMASDAAEEFISTEQKVSNKMVDAKVKIEKVNKSLESLIKTREKINKVNDESAESQATLQLLRKQEKQDIQDLNKYNKAYNKGLIKIKDSTDDIITSTEELIDTIKDKALSQIFTDLSSDILKKRIAAKTVSTKFRKWLRTEMQPTPGKGVSKSLSQVIKDTKADYDKTGYSWEKLRTRWVGVLKKYLKRYGGGLDITEFEKALKSDYYDKEIAVLKKEIERESGNKLQDILNIGGGGGDDDDDDDDEGCDEGYHWDPIKKKCVKDETDAIYGKQKFIQEEETKFRKKRIKDEEDFRLGLLEAQMTGINRYIAQETDEDLLSKAFSEREKLQKKIDDEKHKQLLASIERERQTLKDAAQLAVLTQEEYNAHVLDIGMLAEEKESSLYVRSAESKKLQKEDLFKELNAIDEHQNTKVLLAIRDAGKNESDIRDKINQQTIKNQQDNFQKSEEVLKQEHESAKDILDLAHANDLISDTQHKQLLLYLEEDYLKAKKDLYIKYGEDTAGILSNLNANEVASIELVKEALGDYLSQLGDLGQSMQDLAGDEEKLSGLRQAGVIITQAAATAEKVLAIANTFTALSKAKLNLQEALGIANTPAFLASNASKTVSNIKTAASGFISTISSAAKSMPFPANVLAIGATLGVIFGAYKKIKASFGKAETPNTDGGGGGGGGRSSSGGGRSSSGAMSYYTYGGQHSTYADGGMVYGNSHSQGGEKFAVGGRVVELEGGEAVINKRSTSMFRSQLSAMNSAGGGVKFADGGVTNNPSFAKTQFDVTNQSSNGGSSRVVVVEADITSTQNTIKTIEAEASF